MNDDFEKDINSLIKKHFQEYEIEVQCKIFNMLCKFFEPFLTLLEFKKQHDEAKK